MWNQFRSYISKPSVFTEYLYRKIRAELISHVCFQQRIYSLQQESSAEQVPQRSSFHWPGPRVYPGGQQDEMIPMPILTYFIDIKKDLNFGPNIYTWLYTYVC